MNKNILFSILIIFVLLFIYSCKGDIGPTGSPGRDGSTGPIGPQGLQGSVGLPGATNVIYSSWFNPSGYTVSSILNIINIDYTRSVPSISQSILDNGLILTYGRLSGAASIVWPAGQIGSLPISISFVLFGQYTVDTWSAYSTLGNLRINFVSSANLYNTMSTAHEFRYVIIPGGISGGRVLTGPAAGYTTIQIKNMSYEQVSELFHIPSNGTNEK